MAFFSRSLSSTPIPLKNRITSVRSIPLAFQSVLLKPKSFSFAHHINSSISNKQRFRTKASMAQVGEAKVQVFDSEEGLAVALAEYVSQLSDQYAKERGAFTVALSGGSLIKSLRFRSCYSNWNLLLLVLHWALYLLISLGNFRKIVEAPYIDSVDWSKWHVFWVDDRVVPKDHPDSNYFLAYNDFLSRVRSHCFQFYRSSH